LRIKGTEEQREAVQKARVEKKNGKEATEISGRLRRRDEGASKTSADWQGEQSSFFPLQLVLCSSHKSRTGKASLDSLQMMGESFRQGGVRSFQAHVLLFHLHKTDNAD